MEYQESDPFQPQQGPIAGEAANEGLFIFGETGRKPISCFC